MAHHNRTPQTILDAPALRPLWVIRHDGPNRRDRRKLTFPTGKTITIPPWLRQPATNSPLVRRTRPTITRQDQMYMAAA